MWELLAGSSHIFSLGGKARPYAKTIDPEKWFYDKELYYFLDQIKRATYHECLNDFIADDPSRTVKYRISFKIDKIENEFKNEKI